MIVVYNITFMFHVVVLTLSRLTSRGRGHRRTDQGESGREKMEQSPENDREHATTGHACHESLQNI